ncbi:hypothetical protein [Pedobacter sp. V48]|uniref:hypothetical protein n=1 Tax=Pedobacter sp. V48 TaxID=509635 RepID=UPI0003E47C39|nr:hypothetical protein [Pedobacter sp. V48]ETZ22833.1 hypothetical protein N824_21325 [Pedobacter sp. V48]
MGADELENQKKPTVEIITEESRLNANETPLITITTGETEQKKVFFRINQPRGRALLIAVHL